MLEGDDGLELGHHQIHAGRLEGQHRIDGILGMTGVTQLVAQAFEQELVERAGHFGGQLAGGKARGRLVDQRGDIEGQRGFHQDAQRAEGGTAQAKGVAVAGGHLADTEEANQRIELVGQGQ